MVSFRKNNRIYEMHAVDVKTENTIVADNMVCFLLSLSLVR